MKSDNNKNKILTTNIDIAATDSHNITTISTAGNKQNKKDDNNDYVQADSDADVQPNDDENYNRHQRQHDHLNTVSSCPASILKLDLFLAARANGKTWKDRSITTTTTTTMTTDNSMDYSNIILIYRTEGNANLVLALPQFRKVLRLPKTSVVVVDAPNHHQNSSDGPKEEKQQLQMWCEERVKAVCQHNEFVTKAILTMANYARYIDIIRCLTGNEFILETEIIEIGKEEQRIWINETIRPFRPVQRLDKEFCGQFGLLFPDATLLPEALLATHTHLQAAPSTTTTTTQKTATTTAGTIAPTPMRVFGNTYAIEIKPKQGWLLPSDVKDLLCKKLLQHKQEGATTTRAMTTTAPISAETPTNSSPLDYSLSKAFTRCRYCAMQFLKLKKGKIGALSSYCPMDLFSGVRDRMWMAITALFQCPQNNLRIFQNGNLIYGDHATSLSWNELNENIFKGYTMQMVQLLVNTCLLRSYETEGTKKLEAVDIEENGVFGTEEETITITRKSIKNKTSKKHEQVVEKATNSQGIHVIPGQNHSLTKWAPHNTGADKLAEESRSSQADEKTETEEELLGDDERKLTFIKQRTGERNSEDIRERCFEAEPSSLPKNSVLHKILQLQLLAKQHLAHMAEINNFEDNSAASQISYEALSDLLTGDVVKCLAKLPHAQQYLFGATALDCSVMITFQEVTAEPTSLHRDSHLVRLTDYDKTFLTKVTILDLDPKPDQHFSKWFKQTVEAYRCCAEYIYKQVC